MTMSKIALDRKVRKNSQLLAILMKRDSYFVGEMTTMFITTLT
jgi:hypothetical protein